MNVTTAKITVEFVNTKPKYPKFSSGSLKLADDTWLTVSKEVDINYFKKGKTYSVEVETNDKGYQTITQVVASSEPAAPTITSNNADTKAVKVRDFDAEARGKSRFGLYAAALQSPALAGMDFKGVEEFLKLVRQVAEDGLSYTFEDK